MEQNSFFTGKISNYFTASGFGRVLVIRGRRGERVHELIEKTMKEAGILNGVVISGIATFQKINYHHIRTRQPTRSMRSAQMTGHLKSLRSKDLS